MGTRVACGIVNEIEEIVIRGRYSNRCYLRCTRPFLCPTTIKSKLIIEKNTCTRILDGYISIKEEDGYVGKLEFSYVFREEIV